jgi:hypothetical protein
MRTSPNHAVQRTVPGGACCPAIHSCFRPDRSLTLCVLPNKSYEKRLQARREVPSHCMVDTCLSDLAWPGVYLPSYRTSSEHHRMRSRNPCGIHSSNWIGECPDNWPILRQPVGALFIGEALFVAAGFSAWQAADFRYPIC